MKLILEIKLGPYIVAAYELDTKHLQGNPKTIEIHLAKDAKPPFPTCVTGIPQIEWP